MIAAIQQNRYLNENLEFIARNYRIDSARYRAGLNRPSERENLEGFAYRGGVVYAQNLPGNWEG